MNGKASKQHEVNKNDDDDDDRLKSFQVPKPAVCLSVCFLSVSSFISVSSRDVSIFK